MPSRLAAAFSVLAALAIPCSAQDTDVLLFEDFEDGVPASWSMPDEPWHLVPDGTCGVAATWMVATTKSPACGLPPGKHLATLVTEPFVLTLGSAPVLVEIDYQLKLDADDFAELRIIDLTNPGASESHPLGNTSGPETFATWVVPQGPFIPASTVYLEFHFAEGSALSTGFGWFVDNIRVSYGVWEDLGAAKPGSSGAPGLTGSGLLVPGVSNALDLTNARPSSIAMLVLGLSRLDAPFKGGVLVPEPQWLLPLVTSATGALSLPFTLPPGLPASTTLYFQVWISDPEAGAGIAASNALEGTTPL